MKISVIIPMYNEEDNVLRTLVEVNSIMKDYEDYEILVVDDGSKDETIRLAKEFSLTNPYVHVHRQSVNMGMGRALRTGFEKSDGNIIITIDADLSYNASHINLLTFELLNDETIDIVVGSPYMEGGEVKNVPFFRLFISKVANKFVGYSMSENLSTVTSVLRAYRREVLDSMELESNGTNINLEILSKAIATRYKIKEIPALLEGRQLGKSKLKFRSKTISHVLFSLYEKPMILFGVMGLFLCLIGIVSGIYLFYEYTLGTLDPTRPLMLFMVLMIISGIQILIFGFVATQISLLKREIYIVQKENKLSKK
ncbi:glycosyltransferase family 2 protein [Methanobacterium spitsbergense]|uniref:Glycosyltransferase family 2 protein n=1 Tax=Methanobacterium spitsbergense TaxID=2874285 RepID=A0A8T5UZM8_9EURY|nr:glycosyltransferase family 2 protein [Methanobacterium spitsbergense]MBZ2166169.1 glycosyltransferase family 2 protein [Methanobacterium spitsbergense]